MLLAKPLWISEKNCMSKLSTIDCSLGRHNLGPIYPTQGHHMSMCAAFSLIHIPILQCSKMTMDLGGISRENAVSIVSERAQKHATSILERQNGMFFKVGITPFWCFFYQVPKHRCNIVKKNKKAVPRQ
uniref:Cold-regulated 413 plasma membrane protein 4-like n=1 Tax=Rhizophora mucronata TaxID=61149 RepID=A0A2P2JXY4_RHIMU